MKSIGIYPGTFDPIHEGHMSFAGAARVACGLDVIYFAPEKTPRNKTNVSELQTRVVNIRAATAKSPELDIISLTTERFTVTDTLPEIEAQLGPSAYTLLVGSDVAQRLEGWPEREVLLKKWAVAIGMRNNDSVESIEAMFKRIEDTYGISIRRSFVHTDNSEVSSTDFRSPRHKQK